MNTPQKGQFRHIVFREGQTWYAVALEFNIVESAEDRQLAYMSLLQAVSGYIDSCKKLRGARYKTLNQKADPEYEKMWSAIRTAINSNAPVKSPFEIGMFGVSKV